ncbi:MAG: hypothetical protein HWQ43_26505 [Nostoc sp. JL31]|uniref:hypothetical protein n=1 Tax=Nostoc sp. JL31 TaxID=2815395 RepID=UPI0025CE7D69|nr:hypothetical protein [Nostoc sp. JL31]MBN3892545.1 hypothetical protein [Nostoc sp. JL31]
MQSRISDQTTLTEHLYRHTGMNTAFVCFFHGDTPLSFLGQGETFAAWLMCVEYVHDLTRPPHFDDALQPLTQLSLLLRKTYKQLVEYLRKRHPDIYAAKAAIVEFHLEQELNQISP